MFYTWFHTTDIKKLKLKTILIQWTYLRLRLRILVAEVIAEVICIKLATFPGLADDFPSLHVRVNEGAVHGHCLLICLLPAPSSRVPINIQALGAREGDRGQVIWREAQGERAQGRSRARRFICAACRFAATHGRQMLLGSTANLLCDFGALQLIL